MAHDALASPTPLIIAHRGACGVLPEHTLAGYELAAKQGADAVELDLVVSRDGELIVRHDPELSATTDVADRPEFASRRTRKAIDGGAIDGWFTEDFTAAEIRSLRARQRFSFRDHSVDDRFPVATFMDVLEWAHSRRSQSGRPLLVLAEVKHAQYFASIGLPFEPRLLAAIAATDMSRTILAIQSFEVSVLRDLRDQCTVPLIQLLDAPAARPVDLAAAGDARTFGDLVTPSGLRQVAAYADAIGPWKRLIVPAAGSGGSAVGTTGLAPATSLVADAHAAGLRVYPWTFRNEARFLAEDYVGDPRREYEQFLELGVDGLITDFPDSVPRR